MGKNKETWNTASYLLTHLNLIKFPIQWEYGQTFFFVLSIRIYLLQL